MKKDKKSQNGPEKMPPSPQTKCLCRKLMEMNERHTGPFLVCADYPGCQKR